MFFNRREDLKNYYVEYRDRSFEECHDQQQNETGIEKSDCKTVLVQQNYY